MATKKTWTTKATATSGDFVEKAKKSEAPHKMTSEEVKEFFKGYYQENGRIFLSNPRSFGDVPDLLELQK